MALLDFFRKKTATTFQNIFAKEMEQMMQQKNVAIIDARTDAEYKQGHIPHAKLMNIMGFSFTKEASKPDTSKTYLVYCRSGQRSVKACNALAKLGVENLYNLSGGLSSWQGKLVVLN